MNDSLVPLSSRAALFEDLERQIEAHSGSGQKMALLLINIERFRKLNALYGYEAGDELLVELGQRIQAVARSKDIIARMGNSEFIMLLPEIKNQGHALLAVHKLITYLQAPFKLNGNPHKINAHVGVSIYPEHAQDATGLLQKAELALMSARHSVEPFFIYSEQGKETRVTDWDLEGRLNYAQEKDELKLYYQPKVCLQTGRLFGAEALIRWETEDRGFVRPDIFIPVAEQSGQIRSITRWVINTALRQIQEWPISEEHLTVAVNISANVIRDTTFVDSIRNALNIWGMKAERLMLEITENTLIEDMSSTIVTLETLKALGVGISIDDFGTGYSSMSYFKNIPANEVKVDQSFVFYMLENEMDQRIVNSVVELAHGFGLTVVAEGVENEATLNALTEMGCDIAQGYHIARPMPQRDFVQWLADYQIKTFPSV
jgi:diguanylate cyclase (GGDEF)-like protein